ncbi:MAG: quinol dehydrogenase ferredoxin subunit NapH [Chromatiaceae bacterium]|nr:quinol dehydrogenase ferredoxin subunit NapH [Chromatiaceae bacterium]
MAIKPRPGKEAVTTKGWLRANKWLILRRMSQFGILGLFLLGPLAGIWIVKGNLAYSMTLDVLPLSDPHILLQAVLAGVEPHKEALIGVSIVIVFYMLIGGRVFCSWVCPVNLVTDLSCCVRRMLGIRSSTQLSRSARYWLLGVTLILPLITGAIVWEMFNPVSMAFRGLVFGLGMAWVILLGIFLFDIFVAKEGWCGRLCPVGAFYSLLGWKSLVRVVAEDREKCDDCMDCFEVCPEEQVIRPALKGAAQGIGPVILSSNCTNCGRCIDVCPEDVFHFGSRFSNQRLNIETIESSRKQDSLSDAA